MFLYEDYKILMICKNEILSNLQSRSILDKFWHVESS